ncbi:hypothetical protein GGI07_002324 [Coemansia sp. Benny D115]|nr:hypothetical protein GGI07_002324 [Coemansia sp. Benny D115]
MKASLFTVLAVALVASVGSAVAQPVDAAATSSVVPNELKSHVWSEGESGHHRPRPSGEDPFSGSHSWDEGHFPGDHSWDVEEHSHHPHSWSDGEEHSHPPHSWSEGDGPHGRHPHGFPGGTPPSGFPSDFPSDAAFFDADFMLEKLSDSSHSHFVPTSVAGAE